MLEFYENPQSPIEQPETFWEPPVFEDLSETNSNSDMLENAAPEQGIPEAISALYAQGFQTLETLYARGYRIGYTQGQNSGLNQGLNQGYTAGYQAGLVAQNMAYHEAHMRVQEENARKIAEAKAQEDLQRQIRMQEEAARAQDLRRAEAARAQNEIGAIENSLLLTHEEKSILSDIFF